MESNLKLQEFEQMLQKLGEQYEEVSLTQMKNNVYKSIKNGKWWNLQAFFSDLESALKETNSTFINDLLKGTFYLPK